MYSYKYKSGQFRHYCQALSSVEPYTKTFHVAVSISNSCQIVFPSVFKNVRVTVHNLLAYGIRIQTFPFFVGILTHCEYSWTSTKQVVQQLIK